MKRPDFERRDAAPGGLAPPGATPHDIAENLTVVMLRSTAGVIGVDLMADFCSAMVEAWAAALAHHTSRQAAFDMLTTLALAIRDEGGVN